MSAATWTRMKGRGEEQLIKIAPLIMWGRKTGGNGGKLGKIEGRHSLALSKSSISMLLFNFRVQLEHGNLVREQANQPFFPFHYCNYVLNYLFPITPKLYYQYLLLLLFPSSRSLPHQSASRSCRFHRCCQPFFILKWQSLGAGAFDNKLCNASSFTYWTTKVFRQMLLFFHDGS